MSESKTGISLQDVKVTPVAITHEKCQLLAVEETLYYPNPEGANLFLKFRNFLKRQFLLSEKNPNARYYYRSHATRSYEKLRHISSGYYYIIHPLSFVRAIWEMVMCAYYTIYFIFIPFRLAHHRCHKMVQSFSDFIIFFDIFGMLDVVMNFFTGYYDRKEHVVVLVPYRIALAYLKRYFLIDFLSSIPYVSIVVYYNQCRLASSSELLNLLKFFRFSSYLSYLRGFFGGFENVNIQVDYIKLIVIFIFVLHFFSCLQTYVAKHSLMNVISAQTLEEEKGKSSFSIYLRELVFTTMTIIKVPADVTGHFKDNELRLILIYVFLSILGMIFLSYGISEILTHLLSNQANELKYKHTVSEMEVFLNIHNLSNNFKVDVQKFFKVRYGGKFFKEKEIFASLPENLQDDLLMELFSTFIQKVEILKDIPSYCVRELIKKLTLEIVFENYFITKAGEPGESMFFLSRGAVAIFSPDGHELCHLEEGSYFGEMALLSEEGLRTASVISIDTCELFRLHKADFHEVISSEPHIYERIQNSVKKRSDHYIAHQARPEQWFLKKEDSL